MGSKKGSGIGPSYVTNVGKALLKPNSLYPPSNTTSPPSQVAMEIPPFVIFPKTK
jgi:hypothetical protein